MPFPVINPAIETFFEPTRILLFGKKFPTLTYDPGPMAGPPAVQEFEPYDVPPGVPPQALPMPPGPVEQALREPNQVFARIYGFSYEGHYYKLPRPLLFLVRGEDERSRNPDGVPGGVADEFYTRFTGVEAKDWRFGSDILVWAVDRYDTAICLDVEIGSFDQVLLQPLAARQDDGSFGGAGGSRNASFFRTRGWGPHQDR